MAITTYTTANSIRAVLGISEPEIPDTTIADAIYEVMLKEDLRGMSLTLRTDFVTLLADLSPTADETRFIEVTQTYCAYQVASQMLGSLKMFSPQTIEDSSTKISRITDPFGGLRESIAASLSYLRGVMLAAYAVITPAAPAPAAVTRVRVVNVGLGLNPITG